MTRIGSRDRRREMNREDSIMRHATSCRPFVPWMIVAAASLWLNARATAAEPLRWKLAAGDSLNYQFKQEMDVEVQSRATGQTRATAGQQLQITWDVQEVNDEGEATILQRFDRIISKLDSASGGHQYDSASEDSAGGMAAMMAPLLDATAEGEFEFVMTARGEVRDVKIPESVEGALAQIPSAKSLGDLASVDGIKRMITRTALLLPEEPPSEGEQWSTGVTVNAPVFGRLNVATGYEYRGTRQVDGATMAVLHPTLTLSGSGNHQMQFKVSDERTSGEVLFNQNAGRLESMRIEYHAVIDVAQAGQTMHEQIDQTIDVQFAAKEGAGTGGQGSEN